MVKVEEDRSGWIDKRRGALHSLMSSDLFYLISQTIVTELVELEGISNGGKNVNNIVMYMTWF